MIWKNVRHHLTLLRTNLRVAARADVLIEKAVTIKYDASIDFGVHCTLQSGVYLYGSRSGNRVTFGDHVAIGAGGMILGEGGVSIGSATHFGPRVVLTTQYGDSQSDMTAAETTLKTAPVSIGRGCWIGAGSILMPGAVLGDACIVSPNSVVFGTWPAGTTLSGNPARRKANPFRADVP